MKAKIVSMKTVNSIVISVTPPYEKAMANRDIEMYKIDTGLVDITKVIKPYCLSVLGSDSDLYKKITKLAYATAWQILTGNYQKEKVIR